MLLRYLKCEHQKFLYDRWAIIIAAGIMIFVPVIVLTLEPYMGSASGNTAVSKLIQGFYLGQAGHTVLAAIYFGQEYKRSTLRTSLLSTPKRWLFLLSKLLCIMTWIVIILVVSAILSFAAISIALPENLSAGEALRYLLPAFLSTVELAAITCAVVILTRSMIVSMAVMVSLILGLGSILLQYCGQMKYIPVISAMNAFFEVKLPIYPNVSTGLSIQAIWAIVLLSAAFFAFSKRYVR